MPDALPELASAVDAGDPVQSRSALRGVPPELDDDALALLAGRAGGGSALATELLLEQLDETGVIRRFVHSALLDETAVDDVCQARQT